MVHGIIKQILRSSKLPASWKVFKYWLKPIIKDTCNCVLKICCEDMIARSVSYIYSEINTVSFSHNKNMRLIANDWNVLFMEKY